ncbi:hypothetical protein RXV95_03060 [Novosphingobium sp. ZN18A2]|uniref:hypothetical protein n=1 Tax=Novosphingobium sp. ZN18A2 TaxID=3079861 RepID=UPI0030D438C1
MIDKFTILVPHLLMAIAIWRLLQRDDLDHDPNFPDQAPVRPARPRRRRTPGA